MNNKELVLPEGWEVKEVKGNKIILGEKEKALPKTWHECFKPFEVEYLDSTSYRNAVPSNLKNPMYALCQLLICHNAWWERLGWRPDWDMPDEKHCIVCKGEAADKQIKSFESCILAFPTYEIRDQFLSSFRDLIEEAKELI